MKMFTKIIGSGLFALATIASTAATIACFSWVLDEPEMPKSLIER